MSGVKSLEVRWPVVLGAVALAFFQTGGTIGASRNQTGDRGIDALAIAIAVLGPLSLILLRRWPQQVMGFVSGITVLYLLRDYAYGPVFACLAIATVSTIVLGHRLAAWLGLGTALLGSFVAVLPAFRDQPWSWGWFSGVLAWGLLVLAVGELLRSRRERALAAREAREESGRRRANEERLQIARELHDVVAHHISLINVQAGVALHIVDRHPEQAQTALTAIKDASKEALVELRSLVGVLRDAGESAPRTPSGGLASLDDLVERSAHAGLTVRKTEEGEVRPLPSAVELAAVRIVQEAITNVVRHSGATSATVVLQYDAEALVVTVQDSGRGLDHPNQPQASMNGTGIVGMRERAEALGGSLQVGPGEAGGVRVHAVLPVRPADMKEGR